MAHNGAFVAVQNAIAAPDEAWPKICADLTTVLHRFECDHIRLPLLSPQENVLMERMGKHYLIRLQLVTLRGIQRDWTHQWLDQLFDAALHSHAQVEWYPNSGRRVSVPKWYLDEAAVLVLIKNAHDPGLYSYLIETAVEMGLPMVRIDPETHEIKRMKGASDGQVDG
jgi:hypothetical protein